MAHPNTPTVVFALFRDRDALESAVDNLKVEGFRNADISVLLPNGTPSPIIDPDPHSKASEGAAAGATGGLAIGSVLGWLAGIGALVIPGIGPIVAAGPIVGALAGAGIAGTVGGLAGALVGAGLPENEAHVYEEYVKGGGMLVSVHVATALESERARDVFEECGAQEVGTGTELPPILPPQRREPPTKELF